jgi:hypothetical protein
MVQENLSESAGWLEREPRLRFLKRQGSVNLNPTYTRLLLVKFTPSLRRQLLQAANPVNFKGFSPACPSSD